ncbi:hypothetical protein ASD11_06645 [Aeromicrobium sp. Root495]|nr:hypothetical protein ASD11_06645 [Aeromicrobium sp. Root495]
MLPDDAADVGDDATWWLRRAAWTYAALRSGELVDSDGQVEKARHPVEIQILGTLTFPDGQLVLGDPYLLDDQPTPITRRLRATPYDVLVAMATVGPDHRRVAASLLVDGSGPVERWTMAHLPSQQPRSLTEHEFFGYPVDAGTGCFAGLAAATVTAEVMLQDAGMLEDPLSLALFEDEPAPGAVLLSPAPGSDSVAAFSSGWGDGYYPTWIGLDAHEEVVVVLTDFLLTNEPFAPPTPATAPPSAPRGWRKLFRRH